MRWGRSGIGGLAGIGGAGLDGVMTCGGWEAGAVDGALATEAMGAEAEDAEVCATIAPPGAAITPFIAGAAGCTGAEG